jgi:hypothetical protein
VNARDKVSLGSLSLLCEDLTTLLSRLKFQSTPLHQVFSQQAPPDIVRLLIEKAADVNARDKVRLGSPFINSERYELTIISLSVASTDSPSLCV